MQQQIALQQQQLAGHFLLLQIGLHFFKQDALHASILFLFLFL